MTKRFNKNRKVYKSVWKLIGKRCLLCSTLNTVPMVTKLQNGPRLEPHLVRALWNLSNMNPIVSHRPVAGRAKRRPSVLTCKSKAPWWLHPKSQLNSLGLTRVTAATPWILKNWRSSRCLTKGSSRSFKKRVTRSKSETSTYLVPLTATPWLTNQMLHSWLLPKGSKLWARRHFCLKKPCKAGRLLKTTVWSQGQSVQQAESYTPQKSSKEVRRTKFPVLAPTTDLLKTNIEEG